MQCDICSTPSLGTIVPARQFSAAVGRGFNPFYNGCIPEYLAKAAEAGFPKRWAESAMHGDTSNSDWNVCPACMSKLSSYLGQGESDGKPTVATSSPPSPAPTNEHADGGPMASAGTVATADIPESLPGAMSLLRVVATVYLVGLAVMFLWLAGLGAGALPLMMALAIAAMYGAAIRYAMIKEHGKATGWMIAAGALNLPIGIIALVVGIVARSAWRRWEDEKRGTQTGQGAGTAPESPGA